MAMSRVILHIDMNAFFASAEQAEHPELRGKPIAVGSSNSRSVLSTASYEARAYGVNSAMPVFMAKKKCPNLIIVEHHFDLYLQKSHEFVEVIRRFSPIIEMASIDECFVDVTYPISKEKDPLKYIKSIQDAILKDTGLKCSIGVAPNKFLAKMASDYKKPMGITLIRKKDIKQILYPLPIEDMFGVGKKSAVRLKELGINTIGDLANYEDVDTLKRTLGKFYYTLIDWANGNGDDIVKTEVEDAKSIGNSTTLPFNTNDISILRETLKQLSDSVSNRANEYKMVGCGVTLTIKDERFKVNTKSKKLQEYISSSASIYDEALNLLEQHYDGVTPIRLLGVTLTHLKHKKEKVEQMNLFNLPKDDEVTEIIDKLNKKIGYTALVKASSKKK